VCKIAQQALPQGRGRRESAPGDVSKPTLRIAFCCFIGSAWSTAPAAALVVSDVIFVAAFAKLGDDRCSC
jgi:hypothetical protein